MIINREQLIQLLIKKTGLEEEQVESQLSELIKRVNKAAEEGESFEVEGFGTFTVEDGDLQFEPNDQLQTEINNKYTGMKPIELIGAFRQPEDEIPEMKEVTDRPDKESWTFDERAADEEASKEEVEERSPAEEPVAESAEDHPHHPQKAESDEVEPEIEEKPAESTAAVPDQMEEQVSEEYELERDEEAEDVDRIGRMLVAAVVLIVLGVSGFFVYDMGLLNNSSGSFTVTDKKETIQKPDNPKNARQTEETTPEPETKKSETTPAVGPSETSASQSREQPSPYGLMGEVNNSVESGYTIVVHSLTSRKQAEGNRQVLSDKGFRAIINEAKIEGRVYYRVGIGQFETIEAAQQAVGKLPEEYQDNNFIKRIQ